MDTAILSESLIIFGCGYIGCEIARRVKSIGWEVSALTRNTDTAANLKEMGVFVVEGNLHEPTWWNKLGPHEHIINCVGAFSPSQDGYRKSYLQGMESVVKWLKRASFRAKNLVFTSSSSVYPQIDHSLVDEKSDTSKASRRAQILLEAENLCLQATGKMAARSFVARYSGLYGPGRHLLVDKIRRGEAMQGSPLRTLNLLHRDDAASSVITMLRAPHEVQGGVFNVCDGQHATRGEIATWVAETLGVSPPEFIGAEEDRGPHRRVSNAKICSDLGWKPNFPNFQTGYQDFLASE